jgi:serine/threonine-protein kinase
MAPSVGDGARSAPFRRIEALFAAGLAQPGPQREAWLNANEPDAAIRRVVHQLLVTDADTRGDAIERALGQAAHGWLDASDGPIANGSTSAGTGHAFDDDFYDSTVAGSDPIAGWRLERRIGAGGMGTVHLARPIAGDGPAVAIKLLRNGMPPALLMHRFEAERKILAMLSHPGIARLFDAGRTLAGRPYLVLEYVEGIAIDAYCDRMQLNLRERVALMAAVCEAVQNAHRNLVVHRDLKPGNILVTPSGEPKLLDFGIAKLIEPEDGSHHANSTVTRLGWMTLSYASPEQIQGEPARPASDVYSLGVLLYRLLTGLSPYGEAESNPSRLARAIVEDDPAPASNRVSVAIGAPMVQLAERRRSTPGLLARMLSGDLDLILAKAMAKEPDRRYDSAGELSADLSRWLQGLPISARPATFRYRAGKLLRRHRLATTLAALLSALAVAFVVVVLVLLARARDERDRATQMSALLTDLFSVAEPGPEQGGSITAQALLDRGADGAAVRLKDQPDAHARFLTTLGRLYQQLGLYDRAEASLKQALSLQRTLVGERSIEVADLTDQLAKIKAASGEFRAAEPLFERSLNLRRALLPSDDVRIGNSINNLALIRHDLGRYEDAEPLYRQIVDAATAPKQDRDATTLGNLALLYFDLGRLQESEAAYRRVLAVRARIYGADDIETAYAHDELGMVLVTRGELAEGKASIERGLRIRRQRLGADHRDVARSLSHLGAAARSMGAFGSAERHQREALDLRMRLLGKDHAELTESHLELGLTLLEQGRLEAAGIELHRARALHAAAVGADHPLQGRPLHALARWAQRSGDCTAALDFAGEAERILPRLDPRRAELRELSAQGARG